MFLQLGTQVYNAIMSPESWQVSGNEASYAEHALIEGKPRLQKTGDTLEEVSFTIRLHASYCKPVEVLNDLNESKTAGEILPLVMGNGEYKGDYVIASAGYTVDTTFPDGGIWQATLNLSLKEFVGISKLEVQQQAARRKAFAVGDRRPVISQPPQKDSDHAAMSKNIQQASAQTDRIDLLVNEYENNISRREAIVLEIDDACDRANNSLNEFNRRMDQAEAIKTKATGLITSAAYVADMITALKTILPPDNLTDLKSVNFYLQSGVRSMNRNSTQVFFPVITRRRVE
ncbi:MAG: phage tail protein [Chitinophagaceae bacterium]|nr:phage tail protein [Chitinophagaceae bacterium]